MLLDPLQNLPIKGNLLLNKERFDRIRGPVTRRESGAYWACLGVRVLCAPLRVCERTGRLVRNLTRDRKTQRVAMHFTLLKYAAHDHSCVDPPTYVDLKVWTPPTKV